MNVPIRYHLIFYLVLIIAVVLLGVLPFSYLLAEQDVIEQQKILEKYTEENMVQSVWLVNQGLSIIDSTLNPQLEPLLYDYLDAYNSSDANPELIDLRGLADTFSRIMNGTVDLYIFNKDGIIEYSTEPDVLGVDFRQYPDFFSALTKVREGSTIYYDRVVRSVENASDVNVVGDLRKFAYIPTPDHRYVLEIGFKSDGFQDIRSKLSYQEMIDRIGETNPDLSDIHIFTIYGYRSASWAVGMNNLTAGNSESIVPPAVYSALNTRNSIHFINQTSGSRSTYLFVDLKNPDAVSDDSIVVALQYNNERMNEMLGAILFRYILFAIAAFAAGIFLALILSKRISGPIREIVADVRQIAEGDLDHRIRVMQTVEFSEMEISINQMIHRIKEYSEELERKRSEMRIASRIQQAILPKEIPVPEGYSIAAVSIPAEEVGGDFYDIFSWNPGTTCFVLADVSGKGLPAALFMVLSRTIIRILTRWTAKSEEVLESSNTIFIEDSGSVSFVTMFFGMLDEKTRTFSYVNAGHNPPVFLKADKTLQTLDPTGPVIGLIDTPEYGEKSIRLSHDDVLVIYSDGVTEAMDPEGQLFGEDRLHAIIKEHSSNHADEIMEMIIQAVRDFAREAPQSDDLTLLVLKVEE